MGLAIDAGSGTKRRACHRHLGVYGGLNVGDEAILTSILAELRRVAPGVELVVFSRDLGHTQRHHDVDRTVNGRDVLKADIGAEVDRLDLLLLGGGGILYDREAGSYLQVAEIAQRRGIPTATYAIGGGPLMRTVERQAVADVVERMQLVTVREMSAKRLFEQIGVEQDVVVTADPALLLEPEPFTEAMLAREGVIKERALVGMSVREPGGATAEIGHAAYHALLANAADYIVARFDADVLFVPMERQDIREAHRVMADMGLADRASVLKGAYSPGQVLGLMQHLELAVGMRLHFLIFAANAGRAARPAALRVEGRLVPRATGAPDAADDSPRARRSAAGVDRPSLGRASQAARAAARADPSDARRGRPDRRARGGPAGVGRSALRRPPRGDLGVVSSRSALRCGGVGGRGERCASPGDVAADHLGGVVGSSGH